MSENPTIIFIGNSELRTTGNNQLLTSSNEQSLENNQPNKRPQKPSLY